MANETGKITTAVSPEGSSNNDLQSYSMVLSITILVISMIFGSGENIVLFLSLYSRKIVLHKSYAIMTSLIISCLFMDVVWSPLEIIRLIKFNQDYGDGYHDNSLKIASHSLLLCLLVLNTLLVILLSVESLLQLSKLLARKIRTIIRLAGLSSILLLAIIFIITYGVISHNNEGIGLQFVHMVNTNSYNMKTALLAICLLLLVAALAIIFIYGRKCESDVSDSESCYSEQEGMFPIPSVNIGGDSTSGEDNVAPMPTLVTQANQTNLPEHGEDDFGELKPITKSKNNLGVDMSKILGRRRHTICQIGETETPQDKAKKYNYVRKFSVDITALQAQLENPKIYGEKGFTSESDLLKAKKGEDANTNKKVPEPLLPLAPKPLLPFAPKPLLPLTPKLLKTGKKNSITEVIEVNEEEEEEEAEKEEHESEHSESVDAKPQIPTPLYRSAEDNTTKKLKLLSLLSVTFVICVFPMFLIEVLRDSVSLQAYMNVLTCTMAFSIIQTVIYPHILSRMDPRIQKATSEILQKFRQTLFCSKINSDHSKLNQIQINVTQL